MRVWGQVALVGVNSAVPTPPPLMAGEIGRGATCADCPGSRGPWSCHSFRVVLIHHPPLPARFRVTWLARCSGTGSYLSTPCAELVIHGQITSTCWLGARGHTAILDRRAPSASLAESTARTLGRYNLYRIEPAARSIGIVGRGLAEPGGRCRAGARMWWWQWNPHERCGGP